MKDKVYTLMDPTKVDGKADNSDSSVLKFLAVIALPLLPYVNITLAISGIINIPNVLIIIIAVLVYVYYIWRITAIMLLNEKERLRVYKKRLENTYDLLSDYADILEIHDDGLLEYKEGMCSYFVTFYSSEDKDKYNKINSLSDFLDTLKPYTFNMYLVNDISSNMLDNRYDKLRESLKNKNAKSRYIKIIEHNKDVIERESLVIKYVIQIIAPFREKFKLKRKLSELALLTDTNSFRDIKVLNSQEVLNFLREDATTAFDLNSLIDTSTLTPEYFKSRVVAYDEEAIEEAVTILNKRDTEARVGKLENAVETAFIPKEF